MKLYIRDKKNVKRNSTEQRTRRNYANQDGDERERQRQSIRRKRRQKRRRQVFFARTIVAAVVFLVFFLFVMLARQIGDWLAGETKSQSFFYDFIIREERKMIYNPPELIVDLLTYNEYSRVGLALPEVNNIFVHYTANPGTTAAQNRSYFENLMHTHETSASAHFIIGIEGEIVQCIPTNEVAYAVAGRNFDSISIECCYESEDGQFTQATYQSLIHLTAWLISKYELDVDDLLRHYDDNGKICPKYYVENPASWEQFKKDVEAYIEENGVEVELIKNKIMHK